MFFVLLVKNKNELKQTISLEFQGNTRRTYRVM